MMDDETIQAYDSRSHFYASEWLNQPEPVEIYTSVQQYFHLGLPTADIGCGSGRDVDWLNRNGFPCVGFDASQGLLAEATARFSQYPFKYAHLPRLSEIPNTSFSNVLCETVIMHLSHEEHPLALESLLRILKPGGVLNLSWRHPLDPKFLREADGRLYEIIAKNSLEEIFHQQGANILKHLLVKSASSGKYIERLIVAKN